jgi:DNA repair protein SbcD/Mre11
MKFIHIADCHIDGFKDPRLAHLGLQSFIFVINKAIKEDIDFLLIAGDLFNSALPRLESLKEVTKELQRLKKHDIPVYVIPGSHDASLSGESMLDVLDITGLVTNVMKGTINKNEKLELSWTIDKKTNTYITGIKGEKGQLEKKYYQQLLPLEIPNDAFSIFMFHSAITQLQPEELKNMSSQDINFLPRGCSYYAGGHVHIKEAYSSPSHASVIFPGPTFPNNFSELEKLNHGSYVFYDSTLEPKYSHNEIVLKKVIKKTIIADNKSASEVSLELLDFANQNCSDSIVLIRLEGTLRSGKTTDITIQESIKTCYSLGAYVVLTNTYALQSEQFLKEESVLGETAQDIENELIKKHVGQQEFLSLKDEEEIIHKLLSRNTLEPLDGEKKTDFVQRVINEIKEIIEK